VIVLVIFGAWMLFFDQNSFLRQMQLKNELKTANEQKQFYLDQIRNDSIFLEELDKNIEVKEKYAREHYLMKKDEEIVFSIVRNQ
jgi:cell division protein FtsB